MKLKEQEFENETLEERKKRLEEIRNLHKPLDRGNMMDYALKHDETHKMNLEKIKQKRRAEIQAEKQRREKLPTFNFRTSTDIDALENLREPGKLLGIEKEKQIAAQTKKKTHEKVANYGKYVKEMYWPKISEKQQY